MRTVTGYVSTRSGYYLPSFSYSTTGPANFIGLRQILTQTQLVKPAPQFSKPPHILVDLNTSPEHRLRNNAIGTIPVVFEFGPAKVEATVFVLPYAFEPILGTDTYDEICRQTYLADNRPV